MTLVMLIDRHTAAFEYDWRTRFHLPLSALFRGEMSWREAWNLTMELLRDPTSHVTAAVGGMDHPWSRESAVLADIYDLTAILNVSEKGRSKLKPYPRPVKPPKETTRSSTKASQDEIRRALAARH